MDTVLGSNPLTRPFAKIGQIRSAGITDLRHGNVLPAGVACFAVAATLGGVPAAATAGRRLDAAHGDGLVPLSSALGRHAEAARCLAFPADRQWVATGTGHIALLHSLPVYHPLRRWLA